MTARVWSAPGWTVLVAVAVIAVAAPGAAEAGRWVPLLLGLVVFTLPHGAVDHHVPRRLGRRGGPRFVAAYLAAVLGGLALWTLAPVATLAAFFLVAAAHWGAGDAWYARAVHRRQPFSGRLDAGLFVLARGALPVALPALAHPAELARGANAILDAVGAGPAPGLSEPVRAAGLGLVALLVAAAAGSAVHAAGPRPRTALVDVGELALLAAFFIVTPAILAVGTYLLAWHAPRHVARLVAADPEQAGQPAGRALVAWTREAAPLTAAALAGLGVLAVGGWQITGATDAVAGAALALIAALTFPHAVVVGWMDREQAVFARGPLLPRTGVAPAGEDLRGRPPSGGGRTAARC